MLLLVFCFGLLEIYQFENVPKRALGCDNKKDNLADCSYSMDNELKFEDLKYLLPIKVCTFYHRD